MTDVNDIVGFCE